MNVPAECPIWIGVQAPREMVQHQVTILEIGVGNLSDTPIEDLTIRIRGKALDATEQIEPDPLDPRSMAPHTYKVQIKAVDFGHVLLSVAAIAVYEGKPWIYEGDIQITVFPSGGQQSISCTITGQAFYGNDLSNLMRVSPAIQQMATERAFHQVALYFNRKATEKQRAPAVSVPSSPVEVARAPVPSWLWVALFGLSLMVLGSLLVNTHAPSPKPPSPAATPPLACTVPVAPVATETSTPGSTPTPAETHPNVEQLLKQVRTLDDLAALPPGFEIRLSSDRSVYRIVAPPADPVSQSWRDRHGIRFSLLPAKSCNVYLIDRDASDTWTLVFPNDRTDSPWADAAEPFAFPGATIIPAPPAGTDTLIAICTMKAIDWKRGFAREVSPFRIAATDPEKEHVLRDIVDTLAAQPAEDWAIATHTIQVVE